MRTVLVPLAVVLMVSSCGETALDQASTSAVTTAATSASSTSTTVVETTTTRASTTTVAPSYDVTITGGTAETPGVTIDGPDRFEYGLGDMVEITILSSVDDELHIHGYDIFFDLVAGSVTTVTFDATIPGIFEAELEGSHTLAFELEITP